MHWHCVQHMAGEAELSANGQITVPAEIRRRLELKSGDKILFLQKQNGEIVVSNASAAAIRKAQAAFTGAAEALGVSSSKLERHRLRNASPLNTSYFPT